VDKPTREINNLRVHYGLKKCTR